MLFSLSNLTLAFTALSALSQLGVNAAPLHGSNETSSLEFDRRGSTQSSLTSVVDHLDTLGRCPTQQEVNQIAEELNGELTNALFWTNGVDLVTQGKIKKKYHKKVLRDVFPGEILDRIRELCGHNPNHSNGDAFMLMSTAMATIATGEAWVLTTQEWSTQVLQNPDVYFQREMTTLHSLKKVHGVLVYYWDGKKLQGGHRAW
ncbi:hypothetical protein K435DRAFT_836680 [Dendrothele bispora CBS 962.96]|uniref:Uncharacterized protein n=1 Tax=Dendrothele bispora (strain CBS 962.96) TaxID=1314807 RepID=A0A4S8MH27_DENBC|nr:hypothetical protein K435DRAFT_836680 [Dendrothele bispora CBS 962.96]